jgi:predicted glycoside hydrolase/deacetylase ChbG (UPF0249 family)
VAEASEKKIVVCADDYGMSTAVNQAVLQLAQMGRLNATSCLVDGPAFAQGAPALKHSGIQMGLHLNFTEKLAATQGIYKPLGQLVRACWLRSLPRAQVNRQINQQLDRFEQLLQCAPQFVDGHQHVHQFPVIRTELLAVLRQRYGRQTPWLRSTCAGALGGLAFMQRLKAGVVQTLGARHFRRLAVRQGFTMNDGFFGVYDFRGGQAAYLRYLRCWLGNARQGDLLMCHPAAMLEPADALATQRLAEYEVLGSQAMVALLLQTGVVLKEDHKPSALAQLRR